MSRAGSAACRARHAAVLLVAFAALFPTAAQAQTVVTLVSSTGQNLTSTNRIVGVSNAFQFTQAQQFTTGDNEDGYVLSAVDVQVDNFQANSTPRVSIYTESAGNPNTSLYVLTNPGTLTDGALNTFTAPANATLDKETKYFVVFEDTGTGSSGRHDLDVTNSNNEDSGAQSGWSIANNTRWRNSNSGSWSSNSNRFMFAVKGTVTGTNTVPGVPTGLTATADGQTEIDLSWTAPTDNGGAAITGYQIEVSTDAGANWSDLEDDTEDTGTTYSHTGLAAGTTRHYRVSAINSVGTGTASSVANATTAAAGTTITLVSNLEQTDALGAATMVAQAFETGTDAAGYGLTSVTLRLESVHDAVRGSLVRITPATSSGPDESDDTKIITLSNPTTVTASADNVFTAPVGTMLAANTTYMVVVSSTDGTAGAEHNMGRTASQSEDSGGADGWSIANQRFYRSTNLESWISSASFMLQMKLTGTAGTAANTPATGKPGITGAAQVGITLTAGTADIDDDDGLTSPGYTYQWLRAGTDIGGATNGTYLLTSSDYGEKIQVKVDFTDDASGAETLTSDETVEVAPAAATCPTDDATVWCTTLTVGHDLDEDGNPASTGFEARSGRTAFGSLGGATFTHLGVDYTITTLLGGSGASHALTLTTTPNLPAGGAGLTLHVQTYGGELDASLADDAEFVTTLEHWFFTGVLAAFVADGATVSDVSLIRGNHDRGRVIPAPPDIGTEVMVRLSFPNTPATGAPGITGAAQVGMTLTAGTADIEDTDGLTSPGYTYQWLRAGTDIGGATNGTYLLTSSDYGEKIQVKVDFTDDASGAETLTSDETVQVAPVAATCPTDDATVWCTTLTAGHSLDADDDPVGSGFEARSGHTAYGSLGGATFTHLGVGYTVTTLRAGGVNDLYFATMPALPAGGAGLTVHVQTYGGELDAPLDEGVFQSGTQDWSFAFKVFSASTAPLSDISLLRVFDRNSPVPSVPDLGTEVMVRLSITNSLATGAPGITGTPQVGQTLTAGIGTIADTDGLPTTFPDDYTLQWVRTVSGVDSDISGATSGTYTVTTADVGNTIKLKVTFTDDANNSEGPLTSDPTAAAVAAAGACPADNDWCTKLTVGEIPGRLGFNIFGTPFGALADSTFAYDGETYEVERVLLWTSPVIVAQVSVNGSASHGVPYGSVFDLGGTTFTVIDNPDTEVQLAYYSWDSPGFALWLPGQEVTVSLAIPDNDPAGGEPGITGAPQVGKVLTATTDGITDPNGRSKAGNGDTFHAYTYQWVREVSGTDTDISGATSRTYTVTAADFGNPIKVKVSFKDNALYSEGPITSEATAAVVAAKGACPAGNDWCATLTVGYFAFDSQTDAFGFGTSAGDESALDVMNIAYGGVTWDIRRMFLQKLATDYTAEIRLDAFLPRGTVFNLGGLELTADAASELGATGLYVWEITAADFTWIKGQDVTVSARLGNIAATGGPGISGTAQVGRELTATTGGITDVDGNTRAENGDTGYDYTYQWVRLDADGTSNAADIAGATSSTYTLAAADEGKKIKVTVVTFKDDRDNDEGPLTSDAYPSGTGTIVPMTTNVPPVFAGGDTQTRTLAETVGDATVAAAANIGAAVVATDTDTGDILVYELGGTDSGKFDIVTTSGQLRTRVGERYDYEDETSYAVTVSVNDGTVTATAAVTINVIDNTTETPPAPAAPTVAPTSGSHTSLDVSWTAPDNTGRPALAGYDLRYRQGSSGSFFNGPQNQTGTSASIGSLSPGTSYEVQVRAQNADGEGAWSPSGTGQTTAEVPSETMVTFGASSYTAVEGGDEVTVAVELSAAPSATVTIPLTKAHLGGATAADYSGVPSSVTFTSGQTRRTFTVTAADDEDDDDGESVQLGFGALPSGFAPGARRTATVALVQDAGVSTWYVWFGKSDYTVTEGNSERITLHLNAPWKPELNEALTVPLFDPQHRGGASAADYSGVPESVTFQPGEILASFTVGATDDSDNDDGESVLLQFRDLFPDDLEPGRYGPHYTTVHIDDNDGETAVTVSFGAATYTAEEGGSAATVRLQLDQAPGREVTIPLTTTNHGGATAADYTVPSSVTFGASETEQSVTFTATDDTVDDDLESVTLGFGSLPSGVSAGSPSSAVVNLDDNDGGETMLTVNFGAAAGTVGTVKEGSSFFLNFSLDKKPGRKLTIPLEYAYLDGATEADFTDLSPSVVFGKNKKRAGVNIRPVEDFEVDRGEGLEVSFGTLPEGVQVGSWGGPTATFLVIDTNGPPGLSVADASVREPPNEHTTACLDFWVTLDRAVDYDVYVDYATEDGTAKAGEDYEEHSGTLVFWESEREKKKRLCVEVLDDDIDESVENMTLVLSNPVGAYLSDPTATGRITSAEGDWAPGGEPEALARVAGLSVEVVAGVLFGDAELSADRRAAFDYLGNRNGVLDLGDLLSWQARCRRGEVHCGGSGSATGAGSPPASPAAPSRKRDGRTPPRRRGGARAGRRGGPGRRGPAVRRRTGWFRALVLGLVVSVLSCDIGENPAHPAQPDPGALHVRLTVPPEAHDIGAMLVVEGPGIDSLSASGFELILADEASSNRREAIIAGSLSTGPVLQVWVPDRHQLGRYRVELVQVAGDDYGLKDLTQYGILISR